MSASDLESFVDDVRPDAVHHGPAILSSKKKKRNKMKRSKSLNVPAKQEPPQLSSSPKPEKRKSSVRRSASEIGSRTTKSANNDKKSKEAAAAKSNPPVSKDSKKETTLPKVKRTKSNNNNNNNNKLKRTKSNRSSNRSKRNSNGNKRKSVVKRRSKSKRSLSSSSSNSSHHSRKSTSSRRSRRKKQKKKKASLPKKRGRKADFFAQAAKQAEYEQVAPGKEEVDKIISNNKVVPVISVPSSLLTVRTKSNYDDRLHQSLLDISNHMSHANLDENSGHVRLMASQSIRNGETKKRTGSRPFPDNQMIVPVDNEAVMRLRIRRLQQSIQDIQLQTQHELAYLLQDTETQKDAMIQLIRDASSPFDALQQMQQSIQHDLAQRGNAWKEEIEWLTKSIKEEQERQQMLLQESSEVSTLTTKVLEEIRLVELNIRLNTAEVQQLSRELQSFTLLSQ